MSLSSTGSYPFFGPRNAGVGVTMVDGGCELIVYMTLEDLRELELDPQESSLAIFRRHLVEIERVACCKFDLCGPPAEDRLLVRLQDLREAAVGGDLLAARLAHTRRDQIVASSSQALRVGRPSKPARAVKPLREATSDVSGSLPSHFAFAR